MDLPFLSSERRWFCLRREAQARELWNLVLAAVRDTGALVVGMTSHEFWPRGFSGVVLIGESHVAVHWWPKNRLLLVDVVSCSREVPAAAFLAAVRRRLAGVGVEAEYPA